MFDRFLVVVNPASTKSKRMERRIAELRNLFPDLPVTRVETPRDGPAATAALLEKCNAQLGPRTLICIGGGDGTINAVVQALLSDSKVTDKARRSVVLPWWGGNANDLACMINGPDPDIPLTTLFRRGHVLPIKPLQFRITNEGDETQCRLAATTASFGATALVAKRLNDPAHRRSWLHRVPGGRFMHEARTAWMTVMGAPLFKAEDASGIRNMYEYTFANGPRFAKIYRIPTQINKEQFYFNSIASKWPVITATKLSLSLRRKSRPENLRTQMSFTVHDAIWAQFDGEPMPVPAHAHIEVTISPQPLFVLSSVINTEAGRDG